MNLTRLAPEHDAAAGRAGIVVPPPVIYLGVLGLGLLLEWLWPTRLLSRPVAVAVGSGLSLALNTWWALALTPALIWIMHAGVVKREEEYLERKFGNDYLRYKQQVPRWL